MKLIRRQLAECYKFIGFQWFQNDYDSEPIAVVILHGSIEQERRDLAAAVEPVLKKYGYKIDEENSE